MWTHGANKNKLSSWKEEHANVKVISLKDAGPPPTRKYQPRMFDACVPL